MAKYIDKNRLILCMNDWMLQNAPVKAGDDTTRADTILDVIKMVEDSPATDVRENVKGEWIYSSSRGWRYCSVCKTEPEPPAFQSRKFCPNCGARMLDVHDTDVGKMGGAEDD